MKERQGLDLSAFLRAYGHPPYKGIHINTLKISPAEFAKKSSFPLGKAVPWARDCFYLDEEKAGGDPTHFAGLFYLQEPSAMCAAPLLEVKEGERVLDLCAAPGGKTAQLAADLGGKGLLVSNEVIEKRAKILSQNVERLGLGNCAVVSASPEQLAKRFPAYFDKILVDAPCSGEGMFRKEPGAVREWSEENVLSCALRQREILKSAAVMLAGGGRLVYSTCTFSQEENERQIGLFLDEHREFSLAEMKLLLPHEMEGEGHFAALLIKKEGAREAGKEFPKTRNAAAERAFSEFCKEYLLDAPEGTLAVLPDGRMYELPPGTPNFQGLRLLRLGTEIGEWDGTRFKPAHALALSAKLRVRQRVEADRKDAVRYLRGETLEAPQGVNGWTAVCYAGYPLGFAKAVGGVLKNHLPKGLRMYGRE